MDQVRSNKKVVQCHGVFDLLHIGHIRHFKEAKKNGDILIVTVTPDRYVNKGVGRPAFPEQLRLEALAAIDIIDYVALNNWPTAVEAIHLLKPAFYVKGSEYEDSTKDITGKISDEDQAVKDIGGSLVFTHDIVFSSSNLINTHMSSFPEDVQKYLKDFSAEYSSEDVISYLKKASSLNVLIIGETIIDEYNYCDPIGMATKDPILTVRYLTGERFAGGILAVANHISNFTNKVTLISMVGEWDTNEDFIKANLNQNIDPVFFYKKNSPTIIKKRYIDNYLRQKLFEVHVIDDQEIDTEQEFFLKELIEDHLASNDLVIVVDFGHGMLTSRVISTICNYSEFLAVNTQTNSGNRGFNVISKYPRADYVCLNHSEIRLETRNRGDNIEQMITMVSEKMNCNRMLITRGRFGTVCFHNGQDFITTPAFAQQVLDRMGAGDAVISLTSLCEYLNAPANIIGFIANAIASQAVATIGHKSSIEPIPLYKYITSLLK